jgi:signal peptidase I
MTSQETKLETKKLPQTDPPDRSSWQKVKDNFQTIAIALILAFLLRTFIAEPRFIPSDSMYPSLETGDRVVVEKVSGYFHPPQRGDIVVFQPPEQLQMQGYEKEQAFIKRVIGQAEETISVRDGIVYLNDRPLEENYIAEVPKYEMGSVRIPQDRLFVMGDNRNNSNDSHIWGFLPTKNVIGRAIFRFWPLDRFGWL